MDWGVGLQDWGREPWGLSYTKTWSYGRRGQRGWHEEDIFEVYLCVGTWLDDDIADDSEEYAWRREW